MTADEIKSTLTAIRAEIKISNDESRDLCRSLSGRSDILQIAEELSFVLKMVIKMGAIPGTVAFMFCEEDQE